jgi:MFS family permease
METPVMPRSTEKRWRYAPNVIALGWVSFLTDMASEMLYPIIPLFLTTTLGASPAIVGLIDGFAEGISTLLRWFAGATSDHYRRRKPFIVAGYTISALSKPVMGMAALAIGWPLFLVARIVDRVGKSIRTAPRDALIADSTRGWHLPFVLGSGLALIAVGALTMLVPLRHSAQRA